LQQIIDVGNADALSNLGVFPRNNTKLMFAGLSGRKKKKGEIFHPINDSLREVEKISTSTKGSKKL